MAARRVDFTPRRPRPGARLIEDAHKRPSFQSGFTPPGAVPGQSDHLNDTIEALAEFHQAHYRSATGLQRAVDRLTALLGTPYALIAMTAATIAWSVLIFGLARPGAHAQAFSWLSLCATCASLLIVVLILSTQRREHLLAERRGQLILELAILSDRKSAKIIALLEEMRRDAPNIHDRHDAESAHMAAPTDLVEVAAALELATREPSA